MSGPQQRSLALTNGAGAKHGGRESDATRTAWPESKPETEGESPTAVAFDFGKLPGNLFGILRSPSTGLEKAHAPGQTALIQGLIFGVGTAVLIPLFQVLTIKLAYGGDLDGGRVFKMMLGGVVFVAAGSGLGMFLRKSIGRSDSGDWQDDVGLFGGATVFLAAGVLAGGIVMIISRETFFLLLAESCATAALLLAGFTYCSGLASVAGVEVRRGV